MPNHRRIVRRTVYPAVIELSMALLAVGLVVMIMLWLMPELWQWLCLCAP